MTAPLLSPWLLAFAMALVHFLWEGALLGLATFLGLRLARKSAPQTRYLIGCLGLLSMGLAFLATVLVFHPGAAPQSLILGFPDTLPRFVTEVGPVKAGVMERLLPWLPWLFLGWASGSAVMALRLGAGLVWLYGPCLRQALPAAEPWQQNLDRLRAALRCPQPVRLLASDLVDSPLVVGFWRAVILVPASAFLAMSPESLEAILTHELAHIRRRDFLINFLQNLAEVMFFFHPAVWWVSSQIRNERENCCDDAAAQVSGGHLAYAQALVDLEALRHAPSSELRLAPAAHGGSLLNRIKRMLMNTTPTLTLTRPGLLALAALPALGATIHMKPEEAPQPKAPRAAIVLVQVPALRAAALPVEAPTLSRPFSPMAQVLAAPSPAPRMASLVAPDTEPPAPKPAPEPPRPPKPIAAAAPQIRLHGGENYLPAFEPAQVVQANMAENPSLVLEIPPGGKLHVETKPSDKLPGSRYAVMTKQTKTFNTQSALSSRQFVNASKRAMLVEVSFRPVHNWNDGLGHISEPPLELSSFNVVLTRSWDPGAPSLLAQGEALTPEAMGSLPELSFHELNVRYRPDRPAYPAEAEATKVEGKVELLIAVDKAGKPLQAQCTSGPEPLRAAAISYGMRWVFAPPMAKGRNQTVKVPLAIAFRLK